MALQGSSSVVTRAPVAWAPVALFYVLASALAWAVALPMWASGSGLATPFAVVLIAVMMFTPAIAAIIVSLAVQKKTVRQAITGFGLWPVRPVGRTLAWAAVGLFGSIALIVASTFFAAALGVIRLDIVGFSGFAAQLHAASPTQIPIPIGLLVLLQLLSIPIGAVVNGLFTIGEEIGWRGWLLPALLPLGQARALAISGAAWGLWHAPVILLGYNFAQPNAYGLALMIVGCTLYGVLIGWLRLRSRSLWPPIFAHGAFNAAAGFSVIVGAAGPTPDPAAAGPLGWAAWIVMAVVIAVLVAVARRRSGRRLS